MNKKLAKLLSDFINELLSVLIYQQDIPLEHKQDLLRYGKFLTDELDKEARK